MDNEFEKKDFFGVEYTWVITDKEMEAFKKLLNIMLTDHRPTKFDEYRYKIALDVFKQYKFNMYDKELNFDNWLERCIKDDFWLNNKY